MIGAGFHSGAGTTGRSSLGQRCLGDLGVSGAGTNAAGTGSRSGLVLVCAGPHGRGNETLATVVTSRCWSAATLCSAASTASSLAEKYPAAPGITADNTAAQAIVKVNCLDMPSPFRP